MHEGEQRPTREVMDAVPGTYIKGYIALANQQRLPVDVVVAARTTRRRRRTWNRRGGCYALITAVGRQVSG